jgi:hypothetical protein
MHIAYAAHTDACTFYLDDDGICRRVLRRRKKAHAALSALTRGANEDDGDKAERCLGAQYVASLDPTEHGGLIALPRVGVPMLFAYVGDNGRIALVRTGPVIRFEEHGTPDDRASQRDTRPTLPGDEPPGQKPDSGVRARPEDDEDDEDDPRTWVAGRRVGERRISDAPVILDETQDAPAIVDVDVAIVPDVPIDVGAPVVPDATAEMPTAIEPEDDGASTQLFRSSRPPAFAARPSMHTTHTTPIPERPSWMPSTRVERVSIVPAAPASSPREIDQGPSTDRVPGTDRDPSPVTPRGRGMLPMRAGRGRG